MNPKTHLIFLLLVLFAVLLTTCEKPERDNPWDEKSTLNPETWAPGNLAVEDMSIISKKLTWTYNGVDNIEGFKLDRKKGEESWQVAFATVLNEARTWNDTTLIPETGLVYQYRLYAYAGNNVSASQSQTSTMDFPAPSDLTITKISDISYKLEWQDNSIGEKGFKIDRKIGDEPWITPFDSIQANTTIYVDTNVFAVKKTTVDVFYRLYATYGSYSSVKIGHETQAELTPPSNLEIKINSISSFTISWTGSNTGEKGYILERRHEDENWELLDTLATTSYTDTTFKLNTTVDYRVAAYHANFISMYLQQNILTTIPPPTNGQLEEISDVSYKLTWNDNSNGEEGFRIDRKTSDGEWIIAFATVEENIKEFVDENVFLEKKATYEIQYHVYAYYGNYESGKVLLTTQAELTPPSNLTITKDSIMSVTLNWQDNSTGEEGFKIERKYENGDWVEVATTTDTSWQDNGFELNTMVYYRVYAYYSQYNSSWIEKPFDATIPPPQNLTITVNSATSVTLNWSYNLTGHEGFKIERKTNQGEWNTIAPNINPEVLSFTDNQVNVEQNDYAYRLSAFAQNTFSDPAIINILAPPCAGVTPPPGFGVVSSSGKCWLDRNLGASRVAQSSTDTLAYGDLYQWGRFTDGHEIRTSGTTSTLSSSNTPEHGNFILAPSSPYDWRSPQNNNLWQGVSGTNNPCPAGYRLPTEAEWNAERQSWSSNNAAGAFNSPLKLPVAGGRSLSNGSLSGVGSYGSYWSATVDGTSSRLLYFFSSNAYMGSGFRASGRSVRCLKD
jgi:uncharacterized protein (TIGR02145 family)